MPSGHVTSAYPLASSHNGRRRRLILLCADAGENQQEMPAQDDSSDIDADVDAFDEESEASVNPAGTSPVPAQRHAERKRRQGGTEKSRTEKSGTRKAGTEQTGTEQAGTESDRIQELLDDTMPRTWVFTGDSLNFDSRQATRGWIEHFADFLTHRLNRRHDIVLNSTVAGTSIRRLRDDIEWRVLRFQPDVVAIMPDPHESFVESPNSGESGSILRDLVQFLHDEGCIVVLCTPPLPANPDTEKSKASKRESANATAARSAAVIRKVARDADAFLVDHFDHWQRSLKREGSLSPLFDRTGNHPSGQGHRKMTRCLLRSLGVQSAQARSR